MCEYVIKLENDIKYYNNGNWVPKEESEKFDWYYADNTARELKNKRINVVIESVQEIAISNGKDS